MRLQPQGSGRRPCPRRQVALIDLDTVASRYERGSIIITSSRAINEWPPLFNDDLLAGAAMDRLLHHGEVIEIEGHSFRNPPRGRPGGRSKRVQRSLEWASRRSFAQARARIPAQPCGVLFVFAHSP